MFNYTPILNDRDVDDALREIEEALDPGKVFVPTFENSWVNYGSTFHDAGFRKDGQGIVHLEGLVKDGTGIPSTIFTLPPLHRPADTLIFAVVSSNAIGRINVKADGTVEATTPSVTTWVSLDGIYFRSAQ